MALGSILAGTGNLYSPRFEIEIENTKLTADMSKVVMDVSVEEKIDEGAGFTLTVFDQFDMASQTFKWLDHELFSVGNTVTVKMGYESDLVPLVTGCITGLEPGFFTGETPTIKITGQDLTYDYMKRVSPARTFTNMSYSDIVRAVGQETGLKVKAEDTGIIEPSISKAGDVSYFTFLQRLARQVGFQFRCDLRVLYFTRPSDDKKEILQLDLGRDIIRFSPRLNTARVYTEVEVRGHNPNNPGLPIIGRAVSGAERAPEPGRTTGSQLVGACHGEHKKVITDVPVNSVEHANLIAESVLNQASDRLIEGEGECIGIPEIRPGTSIRLGNMGKRFSGKYYVTAASHSIGNSGYKTNFTVKRNTL